MWVIRTIVVTLMVAMGTEVVAGDDAPTLSTPTIVEIPKIKTGAKLNTVDSAKVYAGSPSTFVGNWFNTSLGKLKEKQSFTVLQTQAFPSFKGNQIWAQIKPLSDSPQCQQAGTLQPCCIKTCWALIGVQSAADKVSLSNFRITTEPQAELNEEQRAKLLKALLKELSKYRSNPKSWTELKDLPKPETQATTP